MRTLREFLFGVLWAAAHQPSAGIRVIRGSLLAGPRPSFRIPHFAFLLCVALATPLAHALPEAAIGYQGQLALVKDPTGLERLGTPIELRFYLYSEATGGSPIWGRAVSVTPTATGHFATVLSDSIGTPLLDPSPALEAVLGQASATGELWLTFAAGRTESGELAPRQRIQPALKAYAAHSAERGTDGFTVTGTLKAYAFEATDAILESPVRVRNLTVADPEQPFTISGDLTLTGGLALTGGPLSSDSRITLAPGTTGGDFFPLGSIVMWSGAVAEIPDGWALCNGAHGTPDLRGRFLRGAPKGTNPGATGGAATVTLSLSEVPAHTHSVTYEVASNRDVSLFWVTVGKENEDERTWRGTNSNKRGTAMKSNHATQPHENLPPYYALCYIQRIY